ncbi:protein translocase subunit SecD [Verrucomicrobiaceae bacterium N1E253]|uniref:Multifunctional fusion protein n=1 Tax=Oceaniferula marina TaxID=2748318 RepID=A0A851GJP7_9BACT|nr:protein translocase subunit SecD [Oceaniferula marina]NWK54394.1 protein translocase subunit SecD [Oceaniferula marina]
MLASLFSDDRLLTFLAGLGLLGLFFWYFASDYERRKRNIGSAIVLLIALFSFMSIIPKEQWGNVLKGETPISKAHNLKGGIDLIGGSSFTLRVQPSKGDNGEEIPVTPSAVQQAIQTVEGRLNALGTSDTLIVAQGDDRILVQMPGIAPEEAQRTRETLEKIAKLELKAVHPENRVLANQVAADPENEIIPGYDFKVLKDKDEDGKATSENMLVKSRAALDGTYIVHAQELYGPYEGQLDVTLNDEGASRMFDLTSKMTLQEDRLAIVLDGKVLSAPTVQAILGKKFQITGMGNAKEAKALASALLNPLKNPLIVEEERTVSATLGKETIYSGIYAGIAGLGLTLVFVLLYYRFAGMIALIGLGLNICVLFGTMAMFGFTFTLPGIAGIILTIGVAVDANVIIYERLREELAAGKSIKSAINTAYEKAFSAIFDANITTLITALILFWRASGTVKGFAITLTIGILASMLAALLCTRVLFWWFSDAGMLKKLNFLNLIPQRSFDFLGKRKISFPISAALILAGLTVTGIKGTDALGIDFTGGARIAFQFEDDTHISQPDAQKVIDGLKLTKTASSQEEENNIGHLLTVRCANNEVEAGEEADPEIIVEALRKAFPETLGQRVAVLDDNGAEKKDEAGNTITEWKYQAAKETISASLGSEFLTTAVWALIIGLAAILIYITIRFEFSFALGAFAALFHDLLICLGIVVIYGHEMSLIHVGAFLTIAGYSINDTIVIFDRIREDLQTKRGDVKDVMNQAISSTLSRTVLTSATTFVAVLVLFIFGGTALQDFSFTIMIGVIVGTYSSIFIASPIVYIWTKMRGANLRRELLDANLEAEVNPAKG